MSTEPYVPTLLVVRHAVSFPRERLGEPRPISGDAFDRFIAKVKADALREAARKLLADETAVSGTEKAKRNAIYGLWLLDEADRAERGSSDD